MTHQVRQGRIITLFAVKSGYGKTTLATNLAVTLNANGARRVCLLDLDLEFGDIASCLRLEPTHTLLDALPSWGNLDESCSKRLVTPYRPGLDCILAPTEPGAAERIPTGVVDELLALLPALYDYVVIDAPEQFSCHVLAALDSSHHQVLLSTPERPALKSLRRTLDIFDLLAYDPRLRSIVINQADTRLGLTGEEIVRMTRSPIAAQVPYIWDVPASINGGVPLAASNPDHPVSQAIRDFARKYIIPEQDTDGVGSWPA